MILRASRTNRLKKGRSSAETSSCVARRARLEAAAGFPEPLRRVSMVRVKLGWSAATTDVHVFDRPTLYRFLELPFAPFKGLRLVNLLPNQVEPLEVISS